MLSDSEQRPSGAPTQPPPGPSCPPQFSKQHIDYLKSQPSIQEDGGQEDENEEDCQTSRAFLRLDSSWEDQDYDKYLVRRLYSNQPLDASQDLGPSAPKRQRLRAGAKAKGDRTLRVVLQQLKL